MTLPYCQNRLCLQGVATSDKDNLPFFVLPFYIGVQFLRPVCPFPWPSRWPKLWSRPVLALSLPIACLVLALRSRARSSPMAPATDVLTPQQLRVLRHFASRPVPPEATVQQALFAVAGLGGHMKRNGPPGWKVLQRGMTRLLDYEAGWTASEVAARRGRKM